MNFCCSCKLDFGSLEAFDKHRVGKHEYTFSEGLGFDPSVEDGRRCLDEEEMVSSGYFAQNSRGTWSLEKSLRKVREAFSVQPPSG